MTERAIRDFEEAVRTHEMKGASHPEDHEFIEGQYIQAKKTLEKLIKKLRLKAKDKQDA